MMVQALPRRLETRDADAVVAALSRILAPHRMDLRQSGRTVRADVRHVRLASCHLADLAYGAAVRIRSRVPADRVLIHTVAEGESLMTLASGETRTMAPGVMHVSMPGAPLDIAFESSSRHFTANLPVSLWPAGSRLDGRGVDVWLDMMRFALGWADLGGGALEASAGHIASLIANFLKERSLPEADAAPWYVVQARSLMAGLIRQGEETITPAQVAAHVGVGVRTLQLGLRRFAGRTFGEELREMRLAELDRMIAACGREADVTSLMHACGIVSTGRFAGYYRDRFGMLPSARLRG